ncbi:MAG: Nif3-like dinuclear metal center hexameric protein, partial [Clostridia bacterium]|nr:Nif3-like dinuclear metal center hexameric protein [Clostridia bacterium]
MTVSELYRFLENKIPKSLSCEWDNDGLMCCPDPAREVKKVLFALDITEAVVEMAIEKGCDVILSHHPLVFRPVKALTTEGGVPRKLIRLVQNGISAMSFHTRLDAVCGGVNDILAATLGLENVSAFGPEGEQM